jgi:hypothetical protein
MFGSGYAALRSFDSTILRPVWNFSRRCSVIFCLFFRFLSTTMVKWVSVQGVLLSQRNQCFQSVFIRDSSLSLESIITCSSRKGLDLIYGSLNAIMMSPTSTEFRSGRIQMAKLKRRRSWA